MASAEPEKGHKHAVTDDSSGNAPDEESGQVLSRDLKGRHMQMIAIGMSVCLFLLSN